MLDCFNPFSLTRKSCGNFSQLRKKSLGTESSSEEPFDEAHGERSLARVRSAGSRIFSIQSLRDRFPRSLLRDKSFLEPVAL